MKSAVLSSVLMACLLSDQSAGFNVAAPIRHNGGRLTELKMASKHDKNDEQDIPLSQKMAAVGLALTITASSLFGGMAYAADGANYDGFADYAKENQMAQSDVGCFVNKCGEQTKNLFSNPRGIKGVTCLGRCKGEQSCATRCFAEFGSDDLNNWLSCTIEENDCVKVPKDVDNSAENVGYSTAIRNFDPASLIGTWCKFSSDIVSRSAV